jgi:hypothetical protein
MEFASARLVSRIAIETLPPFDKAIPDNPESPGDRNSG